MPSASKQTWSILLAEERFPHVLTCTFSRRESIG
jgi:hypothetical protein